MDFDHRVQKFCTELPQLPNYPNKYKYRKQIFEKLEINPKNLLGVFAKKNPLARRVLFCKRDILSKDPQIAKNIARIANAVQCHS